MGNESAEQGLNSDRDKSPPGGAQRMRERLLGLLGIAPHRLLCGPVLADVAYVPRNVLCG